MKRCVLYNHILVYYYSIAELPPSTTSFHAGRFRNYSFGLLASRVRQVRNFRKLREDVRKCG